MIRGVRVGLSVVAVVALFACKKEEPAAPPPQATQPTAPAPAPAAQVTPQMLGVFKRTKPAAAPESEALVNLGRMLYFETRLSKNHDLSCNSCHHLDEWGVDGEQFSVGHKGQKGGRNAPTVYDAADHVAQFWDGRAKDLVEQAAGPMMNPVEMAMPGEPTVVATLQSIPEYVKLFKEAFPQEKNPITLANAARAIASFEMGLVTRSRFDKLLEGDGAALNEQEKRGLALFVSSGCTACHAGPNLGGQMFQKVGLVKPWPNLTDEGRFKVTGQEADKYVFRVPPLRNIAKTAPYFHDGAVADLKEAVKLMATHQLGRDLSDPDAASIVAFLQTLTGELPTDYIAQPKLPPSTAKTPKPDPT